MKTKMSEHKVNWYWAGMTAEVLKYDQSGEEASLEEVQGRYEGFAGVAEYSFKAKKGGMKGYVKLMGKDGYTLQMRGEDLNKRKRELKAKGIVPPDVGSGKHPREYAVRRQVEILSCDEQDVYERIINTAKSLNVEYQRSVELDGNKRASGGLTVGQAVARYGTRYVKYRGGKEKTQNGRARKLNAIAASMGESPMDTVRIEHLNKLVRDNPKDIASILRLGEDFWQYCLMKRFYVGENPFHSYLMENAGKFKIKVSENVLRSVVKPKSLEADVELNLKHRIEKAHPGDIRYTGLLLIFEFGCSSTTVCKLTWRDFVFRETTDGPVVQVRFQNRENQGSTHNYLRPGSRFAARELKRRYDFLYAKYGEEVLKMRVFQRDKSRKKKEVSNFEYKEEIEEVSAEGE